ncbi:hypothetical protein ACFSJ3_01800 [Corallincola platygyrae]|uniref:Uncharacterized protein n=1 Tax=Corallincola platygyrae TaxID=1193278 RepID=A0ABW4XGR2_9GAMM
MSMFKMLIVTILIVISSVFSCFATPIPLVKYQDVYLHSGEPCSDKLSLNLKSPSFYDDFLSLFYRHPYGDGSSFLGIKACNKKTSKVFSIWVVDNYSSIIDYKGDILFEPSVNINQDLIIDILNETKIRLDKKSLLKNEKLYLEYLVRTLLSLNSNENSSAIKAREDCYYTSASDCVDYLNLFVDYLKSRRTVSRNHDSNYQNLYIINQGLSKRILENEYVTPKHVSLFLRSPISKLNFSNVERRYRLHALISLWSSSNRISRYPILSSVRALNLKEMISNGHLIDLTSNFALSVLKEDSNVAFFPLLDDNGRPYFWNKSDYLYFRLLYLIASRLYLYDSSIASNLWADYLTDKDKNYKDSIWIADGFPVLGGGKIRCGEESDLRKQLFLGFLLSVLENSTDLHRDRLKHRLTELVDYSSCDLTGNKISSFNDKVIVRIINHIYD